MNIVVCLKQVPDTTVVKIDPKTGTLIRDGVPSIINPEDKHALEAALALKEKYGGTRYCNKYGTSSSKRCFKRSFMYGS